MKKIFSKQVQIILFIIMLFAFSPNVFAQSFDGIMYNLDDSAQLSKFSDGNLILYTEETVNLVFDSSQSVYEVTSCEILDNFPATATFNDGVCTIKTNHYGRFELLVNYASEWSNYNFVIGGYSVSDDLFVDIESAYFYNRDFTHYEYYRFNSDEKLSKAFNVYRNCYTTVDGYHCDVNYSFPYGPSKSTSFSGALTGLNVMVPSNMYVADRFYNAFEDQELLITDESVVKYEDGALIALKEGNTTIYVIDKKTNKFYFTQVKVENQNIIGAYERLEFNTAYFNERIELVPTSIEVNANDYYTSSSAVLEDFVVKHLFGEAYVGKDYNNLNVWYNTPDWNNPNIINVHVSFLPNDSEEYIEHVFENITISYFGVYFSNNIQYGTSQTFYNFVQVYGDEEVTYTYDENYISIENGIITPIKHGCFNMSVTAGNNTTSKEVCVFFSHEEQRELRSAINLIPTYEFENSKDDFSNNLEYLEKLVNAKYMEDIPEKYHDYIELKTICVNPKLCATAIDGDLLNPDYFYKSIRYTNSNESLNSVPNVISNIKDVYLVGFDDFIKINNAAKGNEEAYYEKIIDVVNLEELLKDTPITASVVNKKQYGIDNRIYGNLTFVLNLSVDSKIIYSKEIAIVTNPFIHLSIDIEQNDIKRAEYINEYLKELLEVENVNCVISDTFVSAFINDEYTIKFGYTQDPIIPVTSLSYLYTHYEMNVGDQVQVELAYYPANANQMPNLIYTSLNEDVVTVDENGVVTALKNGYGEILIRSDIGYIYSIVILVGTNMQAFLDSLVDDINTHVEVNYGEYRSSGMYAIENQIRPQTMDYNSGWWKYSGSINEVGNELYYTKWHWGNGPGEEYQKFESKPVKITYVLKGIDIEYEHYYLDLLEKTKVNLTYSEGDTSKLYYRVDKPGIVSFNLNGDLMGLAPGITRVDIYGKKETYFNYFYVYVDESNFINTKLRELEQKGVVIDASYIEWSPNSGVKYKIDDYLDFYMFNPIVDCDTESQICSYELELNGQTYTASIPYTIEGMLINGDTHVYLNSGQTHQLNITNYTLNDNKTINYRSFDESICTVTSAGLITANKKGICPVLASNVNNSAIAVNVVVDAEQIRTDLASEYNKIPDEVNVDVVRYSDEIDSGDDTEAYIIYLNEYFRQFFGGSKDYYFMFGLGALSESDDNILEVTFDKNYSFEYNGNYWSTTFTPNGSKKVKFNFLEEPMVADQNLDTIKESLVHDYDLTMSEALRYRVSQKGIGGIVDYCSEFKNSIHRFAGYDYIFDARAGSAFDGTTAVEGGFVVVTYNGAPVYSTQAFFTARYYLPSDAPQNQAAFIEYLKNVIKEEFLKLIDPTDNQYGVGMTMEPRTVLYAGTPNVEPNVEVEYLKNSGSGELYLVTINDLSFGLEVARDKNIDYPDMATNITLNTDKMTLDLGQSAKVTYTLEPIGAAKAKVYWFTSNPNVARVDNGQIFAVGAGEAIITASVDGVSATVLVTVNNKKLDQIITSQGYKLSGTFVHGFGLDETIASLQNKIGNDITIESNNNKIVGTGTKITYKGQQFVAVIYGDLSGDGVINSADLLKMRQHLLGTGVLEGAYKQAASVVNGQTINSADLLKLRQHLLGTNIIVQG
ncbi:MAG: hypothetical protein E7164_01710 [Firmicutes bacterium]|nr:hypothetical protein [Bacillota bacterium]